MGRIVRIPAGQNLQNTKGLSIRTLFQNTGIPGYFSMTMDIPPCILDMEMPEEDYFLVFRDEKVPRDELKCGIVRIPSVQQVLWAIGWANMEMTHVICEKPIRFAHHPFRVHQCPWPGSDPWRQIVVSQSATGYSVETVCVKDDSQGVFWAYLK
jgi:hypothetical protein